MKIAKLLYASLLGASLLLGGHLTYLMGQKSIPTKGDVKKQLYSVVHDIVTYDSVKMVNGYEEFKGARSGTAFIMKLKGKQYVITNAHVCDANIKRYARAYVSEKIFVRLKIIKSDWVSDLCVLEQNDLINKFNPLLGITLSDKAPVVGKLYGSLGFNGLEYRVAQLGELLGQRQIWTRKLNIDHQPTKFGIKINNLQLPLSTRKNLCKEPNYIQVVPNPIKQLMKMMGAPEVHMKNIPDLLVCWMSEYQDVYDFHIVGGASGSPVVDLKTGKLVGVVSQFVHRDRHYGGVIPFKMVKQFLEDTIK